MIFSDHSTIFSKQKDIQYEKISKFLFTFLTLDLGNPETLELVTGALDAVLATVTYPRCSVFLLTDGNTSSATMFTVRCQIFL